MKLEVDKIYQYRQRSPKGAYKSCRLVGFDRGEPVVYDRAYGYMLLHSGVWELRDPKIPSEEFREELDGILSSHAYRKSIINSSSAEFPTLLDWAVSLVLELQHAIDDEKIRQGASE